MKPLDARPSAGEDELTTRNGEGSSSSHRAEGDGASAPALPSVRGRPCAWCDWRIPARGQPYSGAYREPEGFVCVFCLSRRVELGR